MKNIFEIFKKSIFDVRLYREVSVAPLRNGIRYYVKVVLLFSFFATFAFGLFSVPQGVRFMREEAPLFVQEKYPEGLEVTIKNGEVFTNTTSPSFISGKKEALTTLFQDSSIENILVIDTQHDYSKEVFDSYHTFALLTKYNIATRGAEGRVTVQSLRGFPEVTITGTLLINFLEKLNNSLALFVILSLVM